MTVPKLFIPAFDCDAFKSKLYNKIFVLKSARIMQATNEVTNIDILRAQINYSGPKLILRQ